MRAAIWIAAVVGIAVAGAFVWRWWSRRTASGRSVQLARGSGILQRGGARLLGVMTGMDASSGIAVPDAGLTGGSVGPRPDTSLGRVTRSGVI